MKRITILLALSTALVFAVAGANAATPTSFFNGFETGKAGWDHYGDQYTPERVASGTNGVSSKTGSWHAEAALNAGSATNWGGESTTFPANGYTTSVDVYLSVGGPYANDTRFDWDSAIGDTTGQPRRDFVFNCGYYNDSDATGNGARFVCSASNNAGRSGAFPKNPDRSPYSINTSGWYTFQHRFFNTGGKLAVDLSILDGSDKLTTWTLSDATDVIGQPIGGNQYGWFATQELPFLAFDNSRLSVAPTCTPTGFLRDGINLTAAQIGGDVTGTLDATGCDIGVYYGPGTNLGKVEGASISNARYFGVVNDGRAVNVKNSTISNIGDSPFNGMQRGVGIFYTTEHVEWTPTTGASANGTISGNTLPSYQKGGITVRGAKASADILNNTVTGSGQVSYIAQNGIQVSFGATALVKGNAVTGNWYTPASNVACGLLLYDAKGVKQQANSFSANEMNLCNVGRGGGNVSA